MSVAMMLAGAERARISVERIRSALIALGAAGAQRQASSITSCRTEEIRCCSGIRETGKRCASHVMTARRRERMVDGRRGGH
jgi:hypothetical protein